MILPGFLMRAGRRVDLGEESSLRAVMTGTVCRLAFLPTSASVTNVAFGSKAEVQRGPRNVRSWGQSGRNQRDNGHRPPDGKSSPSDNSETMALR